MTTTCCLSRKGEGIFFYATCLFQPLLRCKSHVDGFGQIAEELVSHPCKAADRLLADESQQNCRQFWIAITEIGGWNPILGKAWKRGLCLLPIVKNECSIWGVCLESMLIHFCREEDRALQPNSVQVSFLWIRNRYKHGQTWTLPHSVDVKPTSIFRGLRALLSNPHLTLGREICQSTLRWPQ